MFMCWLPVNSVVLIAVVIILLLWLVGFDLLFVGCFAVVCVCAFGQVVGLLRFAGYAVLWTSACVLDGLLSVLVVVCG